MWEPVLYEGAVYRPPSEARSLIIQATIGCSQNRCAFCSMYKDKRFYLRPLAEVLADVGRARDFYPRVERIFFADGDALIRPAADWLELLSTVRRLYPECSRVGCYASPKSALLKTGAELETLHKAGLGIAYLGLESGSGAVLKAMEKGCSPEEIVTAGQKLKAAGMALSVTAINGLGGLADLETHAVETGRALSRMKPDYIGLLTLMLEPGMPLAARAAKGEFTLPGPADILREIRLILEHCDSEGSLFRANHASNYLALGGRLNRDKPRLVAQIDGALSGGARLRPEWLRGL